MALIPPFFLDSVVAIGFMAPDGTVQYQATGFLLGRGLGTKDVNGDKLYGVFLVTNRHVFEGQQQAKIRFNPAAGGPAKVYDLDLVDTSGAPSWKRHQDPGVDIAVQSINVGLLKKDAIQYAFFAEDQHILDGKKAVELGLAEGDGVFVLGFPMGLVGEERNYVIVRQGAIARVQDALAGKTQNFLIDAPIFPGNSGGPVVSRPEMISIEGTKSLSSAYLIGVVSSYVPYQDIAVSQQTKRPRIIFEENSGLATVVPVDRALEATSQLMESPKPQAPPATQSPKMDEPSAKAPKN